MGESTKAVCALLIVVASFTTLSVWMADNPGVTIWTLRIGAPLIGILSLAKIFFLHFRRDLEFDYLKSTIGNYYNRDGFCFALVATAEHDVAYMNMFFQTQYDRPCIGRIAARPSRGFFLTRANIAVITFEIECPAAAFGVASIAIPVPAELQGKRQSFNVGASIRYPCGKGRRLRFSDGIFLRSNSNFGSGFRTALTIASGAGGSVVLSKPATVKIELPTDVATDIPENIAPEIKILWQLGQPPIEEVKS
jgi:hypothetical protein